MDSYFIFVYFCINQDIVTLYVYTFVLTKKWTLFLYLSCFLLHYNCGSVIWGLGAYSIVKVILTVTKGYSIVIKVSCNSSMWFISIKDNRLMHM